MIRIVITPPEIRDDEPQRITAALDAGWDAVHLRHPGATITDVRRIIESVPQKYHRRLHLHGHFALTDEFNLGGLHLNSRCPAPPDNYRGCKSVTCHTVDEVLSAASTGEIAYATLSPVFDSVSKHDYKAAFTSGQLEPLRPIDGIKVIALGGITPATAAQLDPEIFGGYAVLGYLTEAADMDEYISRLNEFNR